MDRLLVGLLLLAVAAPVVPLLLWAVAGQWGYPAVLPTELSGRGLALLVDPRQQVLRGLGTSLGIAVAVAVLAVAVGFPAGRALGTHRFRGRRLVQLLLLLPVVVPGLAVTLGLQVFFIRAGLSDTVAGVVLVQLLPAVPYTATVLGGAFANLDLDLERQARALGASTLQALVHVTLPVLRPALVAAGLFAFLISWSEYVLTLLVGGGTVATLPLLLFAAIGGTDTTAAAALGVLLVAVPLVLVLAAGRVLGARSSAGLGGFGRL